MWSIKKWLLSDKMFLIIDNYDSFVFNLADYIHQAGQTTHIMLNDQICVADIERINPQGIFISPGPKHPQDIPNVIDIIQKYAPTIPIFGICLGHQAIGYAFGADISMVSPVHGYTSQITHRENSIIFNTLPQTMTVGRYHSLAIMDSPQSPLPPCLRVTAVTDNDLIMAVEHTQYPTYGVQFHPESILTPDGLLMIKNFISVCKNKE